VPTFAQSQDAIKAAELFVQGSHSSPPKRIGSFKSQIRARNTSLAKYDRWRLGSSFTLD
jgi:hypothetical protein